MCKAMAQMAVGHETNMTVDYGMKQNQLNYDKYELYGIREALIPNNGDRVLDLVSGSR